MFEEEPKKRISAHEVGMALDGLSIEELETRIVLLEQEIVRMRDSIRAKQSTRSAADQLFKL
jgi:uncharacterized small protein (DUF1192 family)